VAVVVAVVLHQTLYRVVAAGLVVVCLGHLFYLVALLILLLLVVVELAVLEL
jgi:hypothetical protein